MKHILTFKLPPSVNKRFIVKRFTNRQILSTDTRNYRDRATAEIKQYLTEHNIKPPVFIKPYWFGIKWYLDSWKKDFHNLEKSLFDCMQFGGIILNDSMIRRERDFVEKDAENPRVEVCFETNN